MEYIKNTLLNNSECESAFIYSIKSAKKFVFNLDKDYGRNLYELIVIAQYETQITITAKVFPKENSFEFKNVDSDSYQISLFFIEQVQMCAEIVNIKFNGRCKYNSCIC